MLLEDKGGEERKYSWNYCSLIAMLNYLARTTRSDIMMSAHQCARFYEDPNLSQDKAVERIIKHLMGTKHSGI